MHFKSPRLTPTQPKNDLNAVYAGVLKFTEKKCSRQEDCGPSHVCMNQAQGVSKCIAKPELPAQVFRPPFPSGAKVVCTQSYGNLEGTHGWPSAFFALDLTTPYDLPAGKIVAAADGVAYVSNACPNPSRDRMISSLTTVAVTAGATTSESITETALFPCTRIFRRSL